jgi:hypothetical protein
MEQDQNFPRPQILVPTSSLPPLFPALATRLHHLPVKQNQCCRLRSRTVGLYSQFHCLLLCFCPENPPQFWLFGCFQFVWIFAAVKLYPQCPSLPTFWSVPKVSNDLGPVVSHLAGAPKATTCVVSLFMLQSDANCGGVSQDGKFGSHCLSSLDKYLPIPQAHTQEADCHSWCADHVMELNSPRCICFGWFREVSSLYQVVPSLTLSYHMLCWSWPIWSIQWFTLNFPSEQGTDTLHCLYHLLILHTKTGNWLWVMLSIVPMQYIPGSGLPETRSQSL